MIAEENSIELIKLLFKNKIYNFRVGESIEDAICFTFYKYKQYTLNCELYRDGDIAYVYNKDKQIIECKDVKDIYQLLVNIKRILRLETNNER